MFSDRFATEFIFTITQTVHPSIESTDDPKKMLEMFTTHLEVKGRLHVMKSLSLLKGKIMSESKKRMTACY